MFLSWIGAEFACHFGHLVGGLGKQRRIGSPDVVHPYSLRLDPNFLEQLLYMSNGSFCFQISFQEMTIAFLSPADHYGIRTVFEGLHEDTGFHLAGAHELYHTNIR